MKNFFIFFLLINVLSFQVDANEFRRVTCDISFDTDYAPISIFNGFKRSNYDISNTVEIDVPITSNPQLQTLVYESPELLNFFGKTIKFTANLTADPLTNKKKLFIGIYEVIQGNGMSHRVDALDNLMFLSVTSQTENYEGELIDKTELYLPIASAVSDSGAVEIFSGNYGGSFNNRLKMTCRLKSNPLSYSTFDPETKPREKFTCNIRAKTLNSENEIDEINKRVTLGFLYSEKRDLQPIIEDDHFSGYLNNARIMGNLYIDSQTRKPMFLLGIYQAYGARSYIESKHEEYKPTEQLEAGIMFYMPIAESVSESDYIEVRTLMGFESFVSIKVECKKITNQTVWLESLVYN